MELPHSSLRNKYIEAIKALEEKLKAATSTDSISNEGLLEIQKQLDVLANKYQDDEKIGPARYKLYELQAFIYYFENKDDEALDFIGHAIKLRGTSYAKAERLKQSLLSNANANAKVHSVNSGEIAKGKKQKQLVGVEGWLAIFVVGLILSTASTIFNFFNGGVSLATSDVQALNDYQVGLGDSAQILATIESMGLLIFIALLITSVVLLLRRKKIAKHIVIATLIYGILYNSVDYAMASSLFSSTDLAEYIQPELDTIAGYIGRGIMGAVVWIPYFLVSKRAKATLTR